MFGLSQTAEFGRTIWQVIGSIDGVVPRRFSASKSALQGANPMSKSLSSVLPIRNGNSHNPLVNKNPHLLRPSRIYRLLYFHYSARATAIISSVVPVAL